MAAHHEKTTLARCVRGRRDVAAAGQWLRGLGLYRGQGASAQKDQGGVRRFSEPERRRDGLGRPRAADRLPADATGYRDGAAQQTRIGAEGGGEGAEGDDVSGEAGVDRALSDGLSADRGDE